MLDKALGSPDTMAALRIRLLAAALLAGGLSGCGMFGMGHPSAAAGPAEGTDVGGAMTDLANGDYDGALRLASAVHARDPGNVYATLVMAEVYEATGKTQQARELYGILASGAGTQTMVQGAAGGAREVPVSEVAERHLIALAAAPMPMPTSAMATNAPPSGMAADADANMALRFATLSRLLADGLISQDEYDQRRGANLASLLAGDPEGIGRPAPSTTEVENRMLALVSAYQNHEISADTALAERGQILDALLPANPPRQAMLVRVADPTAAAAALARLQRLVDAHVITAEEMAQAQATISPAAAPAEGMAPPPGGGTPPPPAGPPAKAPPKLPPPSSSNAPRGSRANAIALSSFSSEAEADQGWAALVKQFPAQLGNLTLTLRPERVKAGAIFYRVNAGPVEGPTAANALCKAIRAKAKGQYCFPTLLN